MRSHIITKTYQNLRGFSTDSIYLRTPNISDEAINVHRDPDGTFTPRRGFQCETANIGGLGLTSFDSPCRCGVELVCVHRDGSLYRRVKNSIFISFSSAYPKCWFQFDIFTNPNQFNNSPGWNFQPWSTTAWSMASGESITYNGFIKSAAIVVGNQPLVTTINVQAGHVIQNNDVICVLSQESSTSIETRKVIAVGATSVTFSGGTLTVKNNDRLDIFTEQLFFNGFDEANPYPISQFIAFLNSINGVSAYAEGIVNTPAAFIPIQEFENLLSGESTTLDYYYWERIPSPFYPVLAGSANIINQNALDFENASFCIWDEVLYCTNGYDFPVKYDGQNVYLAGMPMGDRPIATKKGNGKITASLIYHYAITYSQKDNATHLAEGEVSYFFDYTTGGTDEEINVEIHNLIANSGYNTNAALAAGTAATPDRVYGSDSESNYYHFIATSGGQTLIVGDTAYYQDRLIAKVTGGLATGTLIPVINGYGVLVGDTISFVDNAGFTIRRFVQDIDLTVSPNLLEISGSSVDVSNNPDIYAYVESPVYGHIGIASGNQLATTTFNLIITGGIVENNLVVGELVHFFDNQNVFTTRRVVTRSAGNITIDQPASILDGTLIYSDVIDSTQITLKSTKLNPIVTNLLDPISNNLMVNIYRSEGSNFGQLSELKLIQSIPNNSFNDTSVYVDNLANTELLFQTSFANPINAPSPPPKCKYLLTYNNTIIYAGGSRDPADKEWSLDAFYFSEGNQPESVPVATNYQLMPSNNDIVTGVGQSGSCLIIGKSNSIYSISGDILTGQFQVTAVSPGSNIGITSHDSIRAVGGLMYFVHESGVYSIVENQFYPTDKDGDPIPLSKDIDVLFKSKPFNKNKQFVLKRSTAVNFSGDNEYWLFIPCEEVSGTARNANVNSIVLCYDYEKQNWFKWNGINAAGGFARIGTQIFWQERRLSGFVGNTANLYRQHRNFRLIDYADHTSPIPVFWSSSWEDIGYPQVRKKFIRAMLLFDRIDNLNQVNEPYLFFATYLNRFPDNKDTKASVTTVNNSVKWGSAWSWKQWSGAVDPFISIGLKNGTTAKSMQISLQMQKLNTSFKFIGFQLEIAPEYTKTFVR